MPDRTTDIGARIRQAREASGRSRLSVAVELGVDPNTLQRWERGWTNPPALRITVIAAALDVDPTWLLVGDHTEVAS
jgi:transcriptional regulator with XRE-family HTH domain